MIYVIKGFIKGSHATLLVTTNLEKAKALIIGDGNEIEVWENDIHLYDIQYFEDEGFLMVEVEV